MNVYLSPRLSGAATLAEFPDWLDWPGLIKDHGLSVELQCRGNTATVFADTGPLRPDIWQAIFTPEAIVSPYPRPQYSQRLVVSYPAQDVLTFLTSIYQRAATAVLTGRGDGELCRLLEELTFRDGTESTLDSALSELRVTMWHQQQGTNDGIGRAAGVVSSASIRDMATRFALYHRMPPAPNRPPLPSSPADFATLLDFHKALSALAAHPSLLAVARPGRAGRGAARVVPAVARSRAATSTLTVTALTPGWTWADPPTLGQVPTAYVRADGIFAAAPATDPAAVQQGDLVQGDVVDGFLSLDPQYFGLAGVDIDGALIKAMGLADSIAYASRTNTAVDAGAARTAFGRDLADRQPARRAAAAGRSGTTSRSRRCWRADPRRGRSTRATLSAATGWTSGRTVRPSGGRFTGGTAPTGSASMARSR